jgi:glycerophosphoryl diester phosphodiesterase
MADGPRRPDRPAGGAPDAAPARGPGLRRLASPARRARWRRVRREAARHERLRARGRPVPVRGAPRLWQRFLVMPLLTVWEAVTGATVWLFEALRPPPRRILPPLPPGEFLVVGHRGAPGTEVENTLPSFERALAEGANAIETDLCVTKDGEVVVWHDWDPEELVAFARQAGAELEVRCRPAVPPAGHALRRPVCDLTLAEFLSAYGYAEIGGDRTLAVRIPLLEDLVAWAAGRPGLRVVVLDVKIPAARADLVRVVSDRLSRALAHRPCAARFVWLSPHPAVLEALRTACPDAASGQDVEIAPGLGVREGVTSIGPALAAGRAAAGVGRPRFTVGGWGGYARVVAGDLRRLAARGGPPGAPPRLFCWTINRRAELRRLLRMGAPAILTDRAATLAREAARLAR